MPGNTYNKVAYGLSEALPTIFSSPIVSLRIPTTADKAPIGQIWVYKTGNAIYALTSIVANLANWQLLTNIGGAGVFTSLTVNPGPTAITGEFTLVAGGQVTQIANDAAVNLVTIGSTTGASGTTIQGGTGDINIATSAAGRIFIGSIAMTGNIQVGNSTAGQAVFISSAINVGAQSVNIATGASGANSDVNILTGNGTAGTQTLNVLTGTRAGVVNIATGAAAHAVNIGTSNGAASLTLLSGTGVTSLATSPTGQITIGATDMTGTITVGRSTAGQLISIGDNINVADQNISIAGGASGANSNVNILTGNGTAGTQTLNVLTGTRAGVANIGTGLAAHSVNIGTSSGAALTTILAGTGAITLATAATGTITIGAASMTGTITLGQSTGGQFINIGNAVNTAPQVINIASGAGDDSSDVNILTGNANGGTQTFNVLTGTKAGVVNIGTGGAAHTVTIGSSTLTASTSIIAGTAGIFLSAPFVLLPNAIHIYTGAGAPNNLLALSAGDLYVRTDPGGATERMYIATGVGAWTNFTCAA